MAKKIDRAFVKPDILVWARESAGYTLEEVAASSGLSKVRDWEAGDLKPTINQLRTLAKKYRRSLAVFYLQERPAGFKAIPDLRRPAGAEMQRMPPALHLEIRAAHERREIALELLQDMGSQIPSLSMSATLEDDPETVGEEIRHYLHITDSDQKGWRNSRTAFNSWRKRIEEAGVLVFQMNKIDTNVASGFAISVAELPAIAVNRSDFLTRRIFSLAHEFAHLVLAQSGVSGFDIDLTRPPETMGIEVWCNAVAAAVLLPKKILLSERTVRGHEEGNPFWPEGDIVSLAKIFSVSRVAVVRRLLTLGLTDKPFYKSKEKEYAEDYIYRIKDKKDSHKQKEFGGRDMPNEVFSLFGKYFVGIVLTPYHYDRITMRDVSDYLKIKIEHIPKIEQSLMSEATL